VISAAPEDAERKESADAQAMAAAWAVVGHSDVLSASDPQPPRIEKRLEALCTAVPIGARMVSCFG
jgi:hypothetical protein